MVTDDRRVNFTWPPPGLERLQGDLWRVAGRGALGGALLVLPMLFVLTRGQDFASLGPFADAWWVSLVLAALGLAFSVDALVRAARLMGRTSRALSNGYDVRTVGIVVSDLRRDAGFLLQGVRHFAEMGEGERRVVSAFRVWSSLGHALAGLWLPVALSAGLLLGARGVLTPREVAWLTLLPAAVGYLVGGVLGAVEDSRVRRARRAWYRQPWSADVAAGETLMWRMRLAEARGQEFKTGGGAVWAPTVRRLAVVVGAATVLAALPVLTLVPASAVGPVLAAVSVPQFGQYKLRAAQVEAFRGYRLPADESVGAQEAGQLLHDLLFVGTDREPTSGEGLPLRRITEPWLPPDAGDENPTGVAPQRWGDEIFGVVTAGVSPEMRAYLANVAGHPALPLVARLARAGALDVASARWTDPFPAGTSVATLPIPRFGGIREASYALLAAAAFDLASGRPEDAETRVREVISVGFLLGDQGNTILESLVGHVLVRTGAAGLEGLYRATGRTEDAEALAADRELAERVSRRARAELPEGVGATLRAMRNAVTDTTALAGYRWEMLGMIATVTPCLNLEHMVMGPGPEYRAFEQEARAALVRFPSEERLFEVVRHGYWGADPGGEPGALGGILAVSMRSGPGTCGSIVRRWRALSDVF